MRLNELWVSGNKQEERIRKTKGRKMGIFSRFKDIVSSNLNSMLDKAEDPEKMIRLVINEMEETLVELKASCAGAMADQKKVERLLQSSENRVEDWKAKAELAIDKGREDLAREALVEKNRIAESVENFHRELAELQVVVQKYRDDMHLLQEKLEAARKKHRSLVQRHIQATKSVRSNSQGAKSVSLENINRFDRLENRIERMEAEADIERNINQSAPTLEDQFKNLIHDEKVEKELAEIKGRRQTADKES